MACFVPNSTWNRVNFDACIIIGTILPACLAGRHDRARVVALTQSSEFIVRELARDSLCVILGSKPICRPFPSKVTVTPRNCLVLESQRAVNYWAASRHLLGTYYAAAKHLLGKQLGTCWAAFRIAAACSTSGSCPVWFLRSSCCASVLLRDL